MLFKKSKLYLWGGTNVGKSSLVESLVGRSNMKYVFYPGVGIFFMQGFDPFFHKIIIFEEFNVNFYKGSFLKRLLEGRQYSYPVKCGPDSVYYFKGPILFISNDNISEICMDNALLGRLKIIHAVQPLWQGLVKIEPSIKEEVLTPPSEISPAKTVSSANSDEEV